MVPRSGLLAIDLLELINNFFISSRSSSNTCRSLEGIHGVHLVPHSPFQMHELSQHGDCHLSSFEGSAGPMGANQRVLMERMWQQRPTCLRPVHCHLHGLQAPRKNPNTVLYANSLIGVGVASSVYHSSRGEVRKYLRWLDYTMIATATICLSRAIRNENPKLLMAASALCLPFQPLMVSAVHTGMMEVAFARRAVTIPELRMAHNLHKMSSLLGGALFIADDFFPETPYIHAAWHLAAAVGVGTCNKLLE